MVISQLSSCNADAKTILTTLHWHDQLVSGLYLVQDGLPLLIYKLEPARNALCLRWIVQQNIVFISANCNFIFKCTFFIIIIIIKYYTKEMADLIRN